MLATPGLAMLTVIGVGGYLGATGRLSAGGMFAFLQYLALLVSPVAAGAQLLAEWPQGMAAAERIADVLAADSDVAEPAHPRKLAPGGGAIAFEHVMFGYRDHAPVIVDLDLADSRRRVGRARRRERFGQVDARVPALPVLRPALGTRRARRNSNRCRIAPHASQRRVTRVRRHSRVHGEHSCEPRHRQPGGARPRNCACRPARRSRRVHP